MITGTGDHLRPEWPITITGMRTFGLDPAGNFLFTAGTASGRLAAYGINGETGVLTPLATYSVGQSRGSSGNAFRQLTAQKRPRFI